MSEKILIVVTSYSRWDEPPRARHQITNELLRAGYTVLFVECPLSLKELPQYLNRKRFQKRDETLFTYTPTFPLLPQGYWKSRMSIFRFWQKNYLIEQIKAIIKSNCLPQKVCLFNFAHDYFALTDSEYFFKKIYYCNDDFPSLSGEKYRTICTLFEKIVSQNCDVVFAVHTPLFERLKRYNSNCYLSPLGCEAQFVNENAIFVKYSDRLKVLHMGFANRRLDYEWLKHILRDPEIELTMIGPVSEDVKEQINELEKYPTFTRYPTIVGEELYHRMHNYNVCIVPYNKDRFQQELSGPNKLFQYFVAGKPVVITDSPYLFEFEDKFLYRASDKNDFLSKIKQAAREYSESLFMERIAFAKRNSWENRVKEILQIAGIEDIT